MGNISQNELVLKMKLLFCILFFVLLSFSNAVPAGSAESRESPIEDDMILAPAQKKLLLGLAPRNANSWKKYYWPKATVVYSIGKGFRKCLAKYWIVNKG